MVDTERLNSAIAFAALVQGGGRGEGPARAGAPGQDLERTWSLVASVYNALEATKRGELPEEWPGEPITHNSGQPPAQAPPQEEGEEEDEERPRRMPRAPQQPPPQPPRPGRR